MGGISMVSQQRICNPKLSYDLEGVSSTIVPDISSNGFTGVIRGYDRGGVHLEKTTVFGNHLSALTLSGGTQGGYLQLPNGSLNHNQGITISFYANVRELENYATLCSFGEDCCFYLSAMPNPEDTDTILLSPGVTNGGRSQEAALQHWALVHKNTWFHIILTFDIHLPSLCSFYIDGQKVGTFTHPRLSAKDLLDCTDCYMGYGALSKSTVAMSVAQIQIYDYVLANTDISTLFSITDATRVTIELSHLEKLFMEPIIHNLSLPVHGVLDTCIDWNFLTPNILSPEGILYRPSAGEPNATGVIEALVSYNNHSFKKRFSFLVPAMPTDYELLKADIESVVIPFMNQISTDISFPLTGPNGSTFLFESSHPNYINSQGKVTRPKKEPLTVTLTMTGTLRENIYTKSFTLLIHPLYGQKKPPISYHFPASSSHVAIPSPKVTPISMQSIDFQEKGIFRANQDRCLAYLRLLDMDRMLYNFRKTFDIDTKNVLPLGGWEEPSGLLRGHSTGHYLSALAFAYASTRDSIYKDRANYLTEELRFLQKLSQGDPVIFSTSCSPTKASQSLWSKNPSTWGEGFLSAYPPDQFALLEQFTPYATIWAPYYTLHKLLAGLLDCYEQLDNKTALICAKGIGMWVHRRLSTTTPWQRAKMWSLYIAGEYGGINESLTRLSKHTKDPLFLEAAIMFDNPNIFDGLARNQDTITGIHANQHIPQIIGALEEYSATQNTYYYEVARNFWHIVTNHYIYSIGGVGRGENFKESDILAAHIEATRNCETCAAYNMLKLTSMLYTYEPDNSSYMDYYERTLINQIVASQNPIVKTNSHHAVTYMLPIGPGATREYSNDYEDFTCCHGTGMENHVRYSENIYHLDHSFETLYINLFLSSSFHWQSKQVTLVQKTNFPSEYSSITIKGSSHLKLCIRIPYWCQKTFSVSVNGVKQPTQKQDGSYYILNQDFADGDNITIHTPYQLHLCYTPDDLDGLPVASILYGPMVMTAISDVQEFITLCLPPILDDAFIITIDSTPTLEYNHLKFIPMYAAHNMPYHTYFKIELL